MQRDVILDHRQPTPPVEGIPTIAGRIARAAWPVFLLAAVGFAAWHVSRGDLYTPGSTLGYSLGVSGGSMMLILLLYPVRKRISMLRELGPLKHWFRVHTLLGILGPAFILFHSTFRIGSLNAAVALACMVLVSASGLVGRFIYRQIHHGLYGTRATLKDLRAELGRQLTALAPVLTRLPGVKREMGRYVSLANHDPHGRLARAAHFVSLGWNRPLTRWRVDRAIARAAIEAGPKLHADSARLKSLALTIDATLCAAQRSAQFASYERLFALWHIVHLPFVFMLAASAIIHVVAVHMY